MSEVNIKFTPLYGANSDTLSYILRVNSFTFLLDCGWVDPYDTAILEPLVKAVGSIDAVLISHPDPRHLGALPYLFGRLDLASPVYATGAIHKMGQMYMYSTYLTRHSSSDFSTFDLDDVDLAFSRINQLRFQQEVHIPGTGISITPLPAGHLIGGSIWKISTSGEDFVYAVDVNHRREHHLTSAPLDSILSRPAMLIADARFVGRVPSDREKTEKKLLDVCLNTLRADGNVLVPVDAAGRMLELLLIFERHWSEHRLTYPIAVVGPMVHTTLEFARSQLEWMNESLVKSFGHSRDNPFLFRYIKPCTSLSEAKKLSAGPKVIMAVECSMNSGPSRQLFAEWAGDRRTTLVVAMQSSEGGSSPDSGSGSGGGGGSSSKGSIEMHHKSNMCFTSHVIDAARQHQQSPTAPPPVLRLTLGKRVPLKGEELARHIEEHEKRKEEEAMQIDRGITLGDTPMTPTGGSIVSGDSPRARSVKSTASHMTHHTLRMSSARILHATGQEKQKKGDPSSDGLRTNQEEEDDDDDDDDDDDNEHQLPVGASPMAKGGMTACLLEGFESPDGAVMPMFPHEDEWETIEFDDYGCVVDEAELQGARGGSKGRLGRALKSEAAAERIAETPAGKGGAIRDGDRGSEAEVPTKIESKEVMVELHANVVRFDFDGLSDERSMQTMLSHVAPRNLILVHGAGKAAESMAARLTKELEGLHSTVLTPEIGDDVSINVGASFEIALDDRLIQQCAMHAVSGYDVAWVNGIVGPALEADDKDDAMDDDARATEDNKSMDVDNKGMGVDGSSARLQQMHTLLPGSTKTAAVSVDTATAAETTYGGVFIGDVRLSELKKALTNAGIASEFHGGALYCTGQVVVKREPDGNGLVVEGALGDGWFRVKECLTSLYHVC